MAGFAHPAERQLDSTTGTIVVDEHLAHVQLARQPHLAAPVACPDPGDQTIFRAIGDTDRIGFGVERDQHLNRAKDFLLRQSVIGRHFGKQHRRHIIARRRGIVADAAFARHPTVEIDYADAITVHMVKRPNFYDVIVAENMFGDIISDLGAATAGGMGISPSGEIGDDHALFQGAHGSAPDIAGQDAASPIATVLSGVMMLRWLGDRHGDARLYEAAARVEQAVETVLAERIAVPRDLGGTARCSEVANALCRVLA